MVGLLRRRILAARHPARHSWTCCLLRSMSARPTARSSDLIDARPNLWGRKPLIIDPRDRFCGSHRMYRPHGGLLPHPECPMADVLRDMEAIAERPDGTQVPFLAYPTPLFDHSGALLGAVNMLVDISETKRAEKQQAALHQFTDRLYRADSRQAVYDAALDAIDGALGCERASMLLFDKSWCLMLSRGRVIPGAVLVKPLSIDLRLELATRRAGIATTCLARGVIS
jgi:hypothetical protein